MASDKLPPLNWLRGFEAAARHLSFTRAAEELHMTQSAVSQQMKSLEAWFGQPLFIRRPRSLELTDAARGFLPKVQTAFDLLGAGADTFRGVDPDAALDIHANMAFSVLWLAPRLPEFIAAHPWVRLNVSTSVWTTEHTRPYASVEVRFGSGLWDGVRGEPLISDHAYPVCAPDVAAGLSGVEDLPDHRLIDVAGMLQNWQAWCKAAGFELPQGTAVDRASTFVVTMELARNGFGIAMAHDLVASADLSAGRLMQPFDLRLPMTERYYLIVPDRAALNPAARAFHDWLREQAGSL